MSDLVERLRATNKYVRHSQELRDEAADRIEALEAAITAVDVSVEEGEGVSLEYYMKKLGYSAEISTVNGVLAALKDNQENEG